MPAILPDALAMDLKPTPGEWLELEMDFLQELLDAANAYHGGRREAEDEAAMSQRTAANNQGLARKLGIVG